jgi:hypothetical protein
MASDETTNGADGATCQRCGSSISADAFKCLTCGYCPAKSVRWWGSICLIVGLVLTITFIGAIIGLPLIGYGLMQYYRYEKVYPAHTPPEFATTRRE